MALSSRENPDTEANQSEQAEPTQEQPTPDPENTAGEHEAEENQEASPADTESVLGSESRAIFEKMPDRAKSFATHIYEGVYKIPLVNRAVAKMEIAYKQFWADQHEEQAVKLKGKIELVDARSVALSTSRTDIEQAIAELRRMEMPGVASLEHQLKKLDTQQSKLAHERSAVQVKLEERNGKNQMHIDKRDSVADRLIGSYAEKLRPFEKRLEDLSGRESEVDLEASLAEVAHKEKQAELDATEQRMLRLEAALKVSGMSDRQIERHDVIQHHREAVANGRELIRERQAAIAKKKREVRADIAKTNADASPYRHKHGEFVRIKEGRPLQPQAGSRPRLETVSRQSPVDAEPVVEAAEQTAEKVSLDLGIKNWNKFMVKRYGRNSAVHTIDLPLVLKKMKFSANREVDQASFTGIVKAYMKFLKVPQGEVSADLEAFFAPDEDDLRRAA